MAITNSTSKRAVPYMNEFGAGTHSPVVVKTYEFNLTSGDSGGSITLEDKLPGYFIPVGGCVISSGTGVISAGGAQLSIQYGGTAVGTCPATLAAGAVATTVAAATAIGVSPAATSNYALTATIGTAITLTTNGTFYATVTLIPLATKTKVAGVGV